MAYKQFSLDGVGSSVKYGVAGPRVKAETATKFGVRNAADSAYVDFECANMNGTNLTLSGNLTVHGSTTTVESTTLTVQDKLIELAVIPSPGTASDTTADGGGVLLYGTTNKSILWDVVNNNWTLSTNVNIPTGSTYKINNINVLTATSLGSGVVISSLTAVGVLTTGTWNATTVTVPYGGTGSTSFNVQGLLLGNGTSAVSSLPTVASTTKVLMSGGSSAAPSWGWQSSLYDAQGKLVVFGSDAPNATSFLQVNNNTGNSVTTPVVIAANDSNASADTWLAIKAQNNGTILMQSNVDVTGVSIVSTGAGSNANINIYPDTANGGVIVTPSDYATVLETTPNPNALVNASWVSNFVSNNASTARRATVGHGAASVHVGAVLPTPVTGDVYVGRITVKIVSAYSGGSVATAVVTDGTNVLMPITDLDITAPDTYYSATSYAVGSKGAQLSINFFEVDGSTAATPTAGSAIVTCEYIAA